jgi:hypothetical protein
METFREQFRSITAYVILLGKAPIRNEGNSKQISANINLICTCEIKSRIAMAKAAFNKEKTLFTSKLDLNLRKKLVKCYIWSMALYGAETWTLRAADQK